MTLDVASLTPAMKQYYNEAMYQELVYASNPFLALLSKDEKFRGLNMPIPLKISDGGGISSTFSIAQSQAAAGSPVFRGFTLTHVQMFGLAQVDGLVVATSEGSPAAFIDAVTASLDSVYNALSRQVALQLFRSGAGELGQVNAEPAELASVVITLKSRGDATNFSVGQSVEIFATLSGGSARTRDGSVSVMVIAGVDVSAGTITLTGAYDASGTIAANDYLFLQGTRGATSCITGLAGWIPSAAPSATAFFGLDRTVDAQKLAGVRHDGSAQSIEEALIDAAYKVGKVGGKPDIVLLSFEQYGKLVKSLGSKVQFLDLKVGEIGFRALQLNGPKGEIKVLADMNCPSDVAYLLDMKSWKLCSAGKAVGEIIQDNGSTWLRSPTSDGIEARLAFRGNLSCNAPGHNAVVVLPAL